MSAPLFYLFIAVQVLIGYNLLLPAWLLLCSLAWRRQAPGSHDSEADYAIIVTAYEQTSFLPQVVLSILAMHYSNYRVYVVADNCSDGPDLRFADPRVTVLRPEQPLASNTGSHFYAIHRFVRPHERVTIVDSDNLVHPGYLKSLDRYFNQGFAAVQGVRLPKNLNTLFSCLDAARDIYYHFYDGKLLFRAGASATLAGSGMAFTTHLYRQCLEHQDITGAGFDKVLQYEIVRRGYRIAFAPEAIVWDEKTSAPEQLVKQRARWINTWFRYFGFGFGLLGRGLRNLNPNQLLFGLVLLRPPPVSVPDPFAGMHGAEPVVFSGRRLGMGCRVVGILQLLPAGTGIFEYRQTHLPRPARHSPVHVLPGVCAAENAPCQPAVGSYQTFC